jgi:hypothetical protein
MGRPYLGANPVKNFEKVKHICNVSNRRFFEPFYMIFNANFAAVFENVV